MHSLITRLPLHADALVYIDAGLKTLAEKPHFREDLFNPNIVGHIVGVACPTYSSTCYIHEDGDIHVNNILDWSIPCVRRMSIRARVISFSPLENFDADVKANIESDIAKIKCRVYSTQQIGISLVNNILFRINFQCLLSPVDAKNEIEKLATFFNFMGLQISWDRIIFQGNTHFWYNRTTVSCIYPLRIKYIGASSLGALRYYDKWNLLYRAAERHHIGAMRIVNAMSENASYIDVASWLDKAFDWFEGSYRTICREEFKDETSDRKLPKKERTLGSEMEPLFLSDAKFMIGRFEQLLPNEKIPKIPKLDQEVLALVGLTELSPLMQCLELSLILRNNSHHTLVRINAHQTIRVTNEDYISLTAFLINLTWFMLMKRLNIERPDSFYILKEDLRIFDQESEVLYGLSLFINF